MSGTVRNFFPLPTLPSPLLDRSGRPVRRASPPTNTSGAPDIALDILANLDFSSTTDTEVVISRSDGTKDVLSMVKSSTRDGTTITITRLAYNGQSLWVPDTSSQTLSLLEQELVEHVALINANREQSNWNPAEAIRKYTPPPIDTADLVAHLYKSMGVSPADLEITVAGDVITLHFHNHQDFVALGGSAERNRLREAVKIAAERYLAGHHFRTTFR